MTNLDSVRPLHDVEIRDAFFALEASTSAIEKQHSALIAQRDTLKEFHDGRLSREARLQRARFQRHGRRKREGQILRLTVSNEPFTVLDCALTVG